MGGKSLLFIKLFMLRILSSLIIIFPMLVHGMPHWVWEDKFTGNEKEKLTVWITRAEKGLTTLYGSLPFSYRVYFHKKNDGRGPVPWARTDKSNGRTVHFHVNTAYSWKKFDKDWTAPHELSHLLFPYLGKDSAWFAEGIASYLQYQIMYANGTITWEQGTNKLQERFITSSSYKSYDDISIVNLSKVVFETGAFVRLYWGGAAYFLNVDEKLYEQKQLRLNDVIRDYLKCCVFQKHQNAHEMIELFDQISESKVFTETYKNTVLQNGFPETKVALAWLKKNPPTMFDI